ncbi:MAG: hypothetical protein JW795_00605 [Chitinivibrionales bacterium]|nr:hypothetical protein [Chitinivibrionales bacterium]
MFDSTAIGPPNGFLRSAIVASHRNKRPRRNTIIVDMVNCGQTAKSASDTVRSIKS